MINLAQFAAFDGDKDAAVDYYAKGMSCSQAVYLSLLSTATHCSMRGWEMSG